jgi:hypothetical protein
MGMQHWLAEWTCKMDILDVQAAQACSVDVQHGHPARRHGAWTCSIGSIGRDAKWNLHDLHAA